MRYLRSYTAWCASGKRSVMESIEPPSAPGMDVWSARPNDGIPSKRFPPATPVGAARSAARYCGSYRGSLASALGREPPRGQCDSLDESGRGRLHGVVVRALWALPTLEPSTRRRAHHKPRYWKSNRGQRRGGAQHPGTTMANGPLCIRMAGLCYNTQPVEAMPLPGDMSEKTQGRRRRDSYARAPCSWGSSLRSSLHL